MSATTLHSEKKKALVPELRFQEFNGDWNNKKFGALNEVIDSLHQTPKEYVEEGFAMIRVTDVNDGDLDIKKCLKVSQEVFLEFTKRYNPKKDDIIMSRVGTCGASIKLSSDEPVCLGQNTVLLIPKIEKGFVFTFMKSSFFQNQVEKMTVGSTQKTLSLKDLKNFNFNVPTLPEQQKIASFLSAVDEKIQQLSRKAALLEQYKKGVMQQLFSGKLRFKDERGSEYTKWEDKKLGEVAKIKSGLSKEQKDSSTAHRVTRIETISNGTINLEKVGYIEACENIEDFKINKGDILFSNINSVSHIGKTAIADKDLDLYHGMNLLCLRSIEGINSVYLYYFLNTDKLRNYFKTICNQAVSQASINQTELAKTKLLCPSYIEQQKIAGFLSGIDEKIDVVNGELEKMKGFKKGLLQQMFV